MESKLTIVIPAFNAADHIAKSLDSIVSQIKDNLVEIIVINDGSKDHTEKVVASYQKNHPFVRCVTTDNHGPAKARNIGLTEASGTHIWYIDSDDAIKHDAIHRILQSLKRHPNLDILMFGFDIVGPARGPIRYLHRMGSFITKSKEELLPHLAVLYEDNMLNQVWNKVFRVKLLRDNNVRFQDFRYGEDRLFVFDAVNAAHKIKMIGESFYDYSISRRESLISKFYEDKFKVSLLIHERVQKLARDSGALSQEAAEILDYMFIKTVTSCMTNVFSASCTYSLSQKYNYVRDILVNPAVKAAAKRRYNRPAYFKLLAKNISTGAVLPNLASAYLITAASKSAPRLFIRFKHSK